MNESQMTHTQGWWSLSLPWTFVLVRYSNAFLRGPFLSTLTHNFGTRGTGDDGLTSTHSMVWSHSIVRWSNGTCDASCAGDDRMAGTDRKKWIKCVS